MHRSLLVFSALFASLCFSHPQSREQARQMEARGDWQGAASAWRALASQSPKDYRLWTSLGVALGHERRYDDAIAAYRNALALHPEAPATELNLGLAFYEAGKFREALQPLRTAAAAIPDNMQAQILLGLSLYGAAQYEEATWHLEKVVTRGDGNAQLSSVLAQCYLRSGHYPQAVSQFEQLLKRDPDSPGVHMLLGETYDALNRREDAITEFRAAASSKQYVPQAHFGLGYLLWADRRYDDAGAEFRKELDHDPKNGETMAYLGDVEMKKGNRSEAADLLRRSIELQPQRIAHFDLGVIASEQRHLTEAIEEFKRAAALDPKDPNAHNRLAHIFQELHRTGEAQEQFAIIKQLREHTREALVDVMGGADGSTSAGEADR